MTIDAQDMSVQQLGISRVESPLGAMVTSTRTTEHYVDEHDRVLLDDTVSMVAERGEKIAVVGIPKTIDNDIPFIDHSFGFQTAFTEATEPIRAVHVEARSAPNGVGLVKLMGRHLGLIAWYAALAKNDADYVLIPEVPFQLDGPAGFLALLRRRVE